MDMLKITEQAKAKLEKLTGLASPAVIALAKEEDHWLVTVEIVEKRSIPDAMDILGVYEVRMDEEGNIQDFIRTRLRKRGDTVEA